MAINGRGWVGPTSVSCHPSHCASVCAEICALTSPREVCHAHRYATIDDDAPRSVYLPVCTAQRACAAAMIDAQAPRRCRRREGSMLLSSREVVCRVAVQRTCQHATFFVPLLSRARAARCVKYYAQNDARRMVYGAQSFHITADVATLSICSGHSIMFNNTITSSFLQLVLLLLPNCLHQQNNC